MRVVALLQQVYTASDGVAIDIFLVLMDQRNARRSRPLNHLSQPPHHLVPPRVRVSAIACNSGRWIKRKDAYERSAKQMCQLDSALETFQVLIERTIDRHLADGRADSGNFDAMPFQQFFDRDGLLIGEIKHVDVPDPA